MRVYVSHSLSDRADGLAPFIRLWKAVGPAHGNVYRQTASAGGGTPVAL